MSVVDKSTITRAARSQLVALVERAERITGSRMAAYQMVAMQIGRDREWVRHFCNDYASAKIDVTVLNIHEAYRRAGNADGAGHRDITSEMRSADAAGGHSEAAAASSTNN